MKQLVASLMLHFDDQRAAGFSPRGAAKIGACRMRPHLAGAIAFGLALAGFGCDTRTDAHITQIQELEDKLAAQGRSLAEKDAALAQQAAEIQRLRGMDDRARFDRLVRVDRIDLDRLSGAYDENNDGVPDGIVLYLRLYDAENDVLKAAGSLRVALYDLSLPDGQQALIRMDYSADELKPLWFGRFMTSHYTLRLPFGPAFRRPAGQTVTAVVVFTDLLTGRSFETQRALPAQAIVASDIR
ncbi:MAG: hypothetical protein DCC66_12840 [Planctomycetota bacterium]|nr:MAG: hypothetical protein DCC66_12840 [Planctomycetota bacterium]